MPNRRASIEQELEEIAASHDGLLQPADVVAYAQNEEAALHPLFVWNDAIAGQEYRLWQARQIIRVTVSMQPGYERPVRAYVSLLEDRTLEGGGYRTMAAVMGDADRRSGLLAQALQEMDRFRLRYQSLMELAEVFTAMEKTSRRVRRTKRQRKAS